MVFLGPPGTGKNPFSLALGVAAARGGHRAAFATAHDPSNRLAAADGARRLDTDWNACANVPQALIDEVGSIPATPTPPRALRPHQQPQ